MLNPASLVAGVLAIVSLLSPWWGATETVGGFSFFFGIYPGSYSSSYPSQLGQTLTQYGLLLIGLALLGGSLSILGSFTGKSRFAVSGFASTVAAIILYPIVLMYGLSSICNGASWCMLAPTGSNYGWTWGFMLGYYLLIATAVLDSLAVLLNKVFLTDVPVTMSLRNPQVA